MSYEGLCDTCQNTPCCKSFAAPIVFLRDQKKLEKIGRSSINYLSDEIIKRKRVKKIRKKSDSKTCIFFDEQKQLCSIYEHRPFDCKIYPFDIYKINENYHWIIYSCNPDSDWSWTESHLRQLENDPQFVEIVENIQVYSDLTEIEHLKAEARPPHTVLRKIIPQPKEILRMASV